MSSLTNWAKDASLISGIVALILLWKYGDVLLASKVNIETVTPSKHESLARCGLGFLILAIGLYLLSSFL